MSRLISAEFWAATLQAYAAAHQGFAGRLGEYVRLDRLPSKKKLCLPGFPASNIAVKMGLDAT